MKICISGLYSGTNPQPGVGIARSLRAAYPAATLVGVEYSNRCSGIHWSEFDDIWLQPPWEHIDFDSYAKQVKKILDDGSLWISGVDLEIMWLASVFPNGHPNLLTPPTAALRRISKPAVEAHQGLPVRIPTYVSTEQTDWDLHAFCREHGWKVWLKGPFYEAVRTSTWDAFEQVRAILTGAWSTERLFLQEHITGYEESVCFCAYRGQLLDCVYMRKRELTQEGKTWAGEVVDVPDHLLASLRGIVRDLNWTGGAELEMVRDAGEQLWLLECNPRFPAWIHGATITGRNLPAAMVQHVSGVEAQIQVSTTTEFTRVVLEIPVRNDFPLPSLAEPFPGAIGHSLKHPSGTLALAERLQQLHVIEGNGNNHDNVAVDGEVSRKTLIANKPNGNGHRVGNNGNGNGNGRCHLTTPAIATCEVPDTYLRDLENIDLDSIVTPSWLFFESTAASIFQQTSQLMSKLSAGGLRVSCGYSIKTNPDYRLIRMARQSGFLAEAISRAEVQKAIHLGYKPEQVVLNGPGKWWPKVSLPDGAVHAVFADSLSDFERVLQALATGELRAQIVGARLRPPDTASRFGISLKEPGDLMQLVEMVKKLPRKYSFGIHFHMASSNIGVRRWWHLYESMLRWSRSIEHLSARRIECLDMGGGWFPDDWHVKSTDTLETAINRARHALPSLQEIICEPGKAISQPTMVLAMRVLEISENSKKGAKEAVVDGSIAELPMYYVQPHRILHKDTNGHWTTLARGTTRLLGRLCMEHDIVAANVELPDGLTPGDVLVFCDAGAYDRSMSYEFGRG